MTFIDSGVNWNGEMSLSSFFDGDEINLKLSNFWWISLCSWNRRKIFACRTNFFCGKFFALIVEECCSSRPSSPLLHRKFGCFSRILLGEEPALVFSQRFRWICILLKCSAFPRKSLGKENSLRGRDPEKKRKCFRLHNANCRKGKEDFWGVKKKCKIFCRCCKNIHNLRSYLSHKGHLAAP